MKSDSLPYTEVVPQGSLWRAYLVWTFFSFTKESRSNVHGEDIGVEVQWDLVEDLKI